MSTSTDPLTALAQHRLVPVIALQEAAQAAPLADALVAGGLPVAEVTFRTAAAAASIKIMAERGDMIVGAGTVLSIDQAKQAQDAGATFVISPGISADVVEACQKMDLPIYPGVATPTDIQLALSLGLDTVKFFPAEAFGGLKSLKAIAAPYGMLKFIPTGGISPANVLDYLAFDKIVACGGSWMVAPKLYQDGDFSPVKAAVQEAVSLVS